MKVAVVQFHPLLGEVEHNLHRIRVLFESTAADVVIFPELATTGYFFTSREQVAAVALDRASMPLRTLADAAVRKGKVLIIGFAERAGSKLYNAAALFAPETEPFYYRKTHLFYRERFCFDEGDTGFGVCRVEPFDVHIGIMICYDWRFPEAARTLTLRGADLIACPSNLVTHIWRMAMPVRALENKVYIAVANRVGSESDGQETLHFNGRSAIYGYNGSVFAGLGSSEEEVAIAEIDPARTRVKSFNPFNDILADRRRWAYEL